MSAVHDYYTKHSRKASGSQMSLPEQLHNSTNHDADQSMIILPATTYLTPGTSVPDSSHTPTSPDFFYRQYQNQYAQAAGAPLRQGALKTTDLDSSNLSEKDRLISGTAQNISYRNGLSATGQDNVKSHINSPGLRSRKSSVKNLVAQFNTHPPDELPPMPSNSNPKTASRNVSPVLSSGAQFQQSDGPRRPYDSSIMQHGSRGDANTAGVPNQHYTIGYGRGTPEMISHNRRPLFGEVVPSQTQLAIPGYGIHTHRRRSGSEGSPLHDSDLNQQNDPTFASRSNYNAVTSSDAEFTLSPAVYTPPGKQPFHRRSNSEKPSTPQKDFTETVEPHPQMTPRNHRSHAASRIPVSIRRGSSASDFDERPFATIAVSSTPNLALTNQSRQSPSRRQRSPRNVQTSDNKGRRTPVAQDSKNQSLRANIIIPPPKISPPLRSSRPRMPVSAASTATSRAKMAEKFSTLQKMNDEKRQAARRTVKPPELTDIDLKARRLRITQALSRSLEGQDLKGNTDRPRRREFSRSRSRNASPSPPDHDHVDNLIQGTDDIPAVVVEQSLSVMAGSGEHTPVEGIRRQERAFSHNALDAMEGKMRPFSVDDDSPTLGPPDLHYLNRPARLQTDIHGIDHHQEPSSAITEGTMIDPDPQDDFDNEKNGPSVYDQISRMRSHNSFRTSSYDTFSDRADQESVQLIMRNTTYLDDEEAIQKGYRQATPFTDPTAHISELEANQRSSWISSIDDSDQEHDNSFSRISDDAVPPQEGLYTSTPVKRINPHRNMDESVRSTMASDAYTIVNIVLKRHSSLGIVDQQFVDDVYQRILEDAPFEGENNLNPDRIEQICLQEIQDREESWFKPSSDGEPLSKEPSRTEDDDTPTTQQAYGQNNQGDQNSWLMPELDNQGLAPPPFFKGHKYKSSLDSAEDWADTSPSISDWMRFAADDEAEQLANRRSETPANLKDRVNGAVYEQSKEIPTATDNNTQDQKEDEDMYSAPAPRQPSRSPPQLPNEHVPSIGETPLGTAIIQRPQIPRRVTSISQMSRTSTRGRGSPRGRQSPSVSAPVLGKVSTEEAITPQQRQLKQRRNVIKELVDTEFSYEKDLRVLCDIYKQTASAALGEEDIKVLFGNIEQVQVFSKDFLMLLKSLARPTYTMERQDRKKGKMIDKIGGSERPRSSSSTIASVNVHESDVPTIEKDRETRIGQAFEASLIDMEKVYTEYIKNRHAANLRLEAMQKSHSAQEWLKECKDNSSDITNAWNLDALLVKPVQRVTKYPLLLKELVDSTPEDHPDLSYLRRALHEVTEVNIRINDVKKHAELVDQVLNRKRKDSDVRAGLSKAFGRGAGKFKQHVGITELFEDSKYNEIKIHYDNNIVQLMVVGNDCGSYGRAITKWVNKMVEIAAAAEAWVDVGHSNHQVAESKLRQFAMVVRGISTIALPDHLEQLERKVLAPMQQAVDTMTKFKTDPKGLLQKREKRMIDYAQIKSKKDRGEKIDKKMIERMEQSEALNLEAKQRMRKLVTATAKLVQACQANLVQMQVTWQSMIRQKLSAAMGISLEHLELEDIEKEWQLDFDYQEASALSLGICNGSLLAEAVNMVNFQNSTTTLNGEDSPRQASFISVSKRSISGTSESSYPPIPDYDPRTSGTYGHQYHEHQIPYANPRARAQSTTSHKYARTPDLSQHGSAHEGFTNYVRHDTSQGAPRLSLETPSPLIGMLQPETSRRPLSSSTFFSASGTPPPQTQNNTTSIFSSALPMSDSPIVERYPEPNFANDPDVLFTAASVYEFNIDRSRREAGFQYLTYVTGEIFDVIGERGELWLARNQDDPQGQIGWIWNKHFAKLAE